jgi:hypothetical protein
MGKLHDEIGPRLAEWIREQPMFFVGTAPLSGDGHIDGLPGIFPSRAVKFGRGF